MFFLDPFNGGAWPLLVGGVICSVDSFNGRDPSCPVESRIVQKTAIFCSLRRTEVTSGWLLLCRIPCSRNGEILGNSRSVMLLNVLGDTRTTMSVRTRFPSKESCLNQEGGESSESHRPDWDRGLQLLVAQRGMSRRRSSSNCADYVPAICTHRPSLFPMVGKMQVAGPPGPRWSGEKATDISSIEEAKVVTR